MPKVSRLHITPRPSPQKDFVICLLRVMKGCVQSLKNAILKTSSNTKLITLISCTYTTLYCYSEKPHILSYSTSLLTPLYMIKYTSKLHINIYIYNYLVMIKYVNLYTCIRPLRMCFYICGFSSYFFVHLKGTYHAKITFIRCLNTVLWPQCVKTTSL